MVQYNKFKVGDKVKILPSATKVGVESEDVGKIGVIISISTDCSKWYGFMIQMNEVCKAKGYIPARSIGYEMFELLPAKGEQLIFNFME